MNDFLKEKELLLDSIENNTSEHWKNYYKDVPIECIYDDLVIDINEIKRLQEENQTLKEKCEKTRFAIIENCDLRIEIESQKDRISKAIKYMEQWGKEPDADMYMQMKDYNEFKYLLKILKEDNKEEK